MIDQLPRPPMVRDQDAAHVTYTDRVRLSHAELLNRLAWAAAVLDRFPPRPIPMKSAELVAVEAILSDLARNPLAALQALGIGRVAVIIYRPRFRPPDPAIPIAFPLLQNLHYRQAITGILEFQRPFHEFSWERFSKIVHWAISEIIRAGPGQLSDEELAFAILATSHLLSDPSGLGFIARFAPR